ncbi:D-alanyl-D-alanine carboxypeptidase family protein [Candidatus Saccharibacteria bacterium]|nr:D-alanyl-D-alanine carboxypeptidase family protein [Candidatus Saccharibacteria bacterium]
MADVYDGDPIYVEKAAYFAFTLLQHDLSKQGMVIGLYDAFRTYQTQQAVVDYYGNLEGWSETNKMFQPGYSEHHTGLLLNVMIWYSEDGENYEWYTESAERQKTIPFFALLHERLADYGFIDRYPAGKEEWTGAPNEPYEIRFVGSSEVAHAIMDNGLCLEEYLSMNK